MVDRKTDEPIEPRFDGFLVGRGGIGVPLVRNLSQEYREHPEPEDTDRVPPPAPKRFWARLIDRLRGPGREG